jgi:hypothetical protein
MSTFSSDKILLFVFFLCFGNACFAQKPTRVYLDSLLSISDSSFKKNSNLYIVDGIVSDSLQLDSLLMPKDIRYLEDLIFLSHEKYPGLLAEQPVVIIFAYDQKTSIQKREWKVARKLLLKQGTTTSLTINRIAIDKNKALDSFNKIELKDIMYIDTNENENKQEIRIWKKNREDKY